MRGSSDGFVALLLILAVLLGMQACQSGSDKCYSRSGTEAYEVSCS